MKLSRIDGSNYVRVETGVEGIGAIQLWCPEVIASPRGFSSIYPRGSWSGDSACLRQRVGPQDLWGGGNCRLGDDDTCQCAGVSAPVEPPVAWEALVTAGDGRVDFSVSLTNLGDRAILQAGAAVCVKFLAAPWWTDEATFVLSGGRAASLAQMGRQAGLPNGFQAYLLAGASFDNPFYREFWGFNTQRLDEPVMVSENRQAGLCLGVTAPRAYFLHSNPGNPCTDLMLGLGDLPAGATARTSGSLWVHAGEAKALLEALDRRG